MDCLKNNLKISLSILIAFCISFSTLVVFVIQFPIASDERVFAVPNPDEKKQSEFYLQNFDPREKKIFIYGSSMVWSIHGNIIEENLQKNELDYEVYNIGIGGTKPENTEKVLDMIISAQPAVVAYGIADRDFITGEWFPEEEKSTEILPEPSRVFGELFSFLEHTFNFDTEFLSRPMGNTLEVLRGPLDAPLLPIIADDAIKRGQEVETYLEDLPPVAENENVIVLKNIITKLRENDIHVIIFVPPVHKYHIEHLSDNQQKYFSNVLETISNDSEIHIYSLYDYYREMDVWYDFIHVTSSPNFLNYSNDISDIFLKELSP